MTIIDRYILSIFLRMFLSTFSILLTLFITITFFELIDEFVANEAPYKLVLKYFVMKIPEAALNMAPMAVLIGAILSFSVISRTGEVIILFSAGLSVWRIAAPVIIASIVISGLNFLNSELLMPTTWKAANDIFNVQIKKRPKKGIIRKDKIWIKADDETLWNINFADLKKGILYDIMVLSYTDSRTGFKTIFRAKTATPENGSWIFRDIQERSFDEAGNFTEKKIPEMKVVSSIMFDDVKETEKHPQEMNYEELRKYVDKITAAGFDPTMYAVDMYLKITFPFICLVMAMVAIPYSIRTERATSTFAGVTLGIVIGFTFWFFFSMGISLGHGGKISPIIAASGAHLIFIAFSIYKITVMFGGSTAKG
jgi:lipopolysaccharide export system permease protein